VDEETPETTPVLSAAAAEAVVQRAAGIAAAGMPLAAGLRAAAAEAESWRLSRAFRSLAAQLDRGQSLEECLTGSRRLPPHLAGVVRAAQRSGQFGPLLAEWLENRRSARQHWRSVLAALAYPALSVGLALAVFVLFSALVVGAFKQMYEEFGLKLPAATVAVIAFSEVGLRVLPVCVGVGTLAAVGVRLLGGRAGWSWLVTNLPLIGPPWHWTGTAEMLRSLSLLVEHRLPLGEALRLTADGITDGYVASQCRTLARGVEQGRPFAMTLIDLRTLPLSIVPLVRWGEQHDALSDSLRAAAEMIEGRLKLRTAVLVQVIPPFVFVVVGMMIVAGISAMFLPLISLIRGLS
jgi:general secretion pathway protein F